MEFGALCGCHQRYDRSFFIHGYQFPICARCTGVFLGELLTIIAAVLKKFFSYKTSICFLLIMGFDWFIQYVKIKPSSNIRRFITGILGGIGITTLYLHIIYKIINKFKHT